MKTLRWIAPLLIGASWGQTTSAERSTPIAETQLYQPGETANRLHAALFMRYGPDGRWHGEDVIDPLYWGGTQHLLTGASYESARNALDLSIAEKNAVEKLPALQRVVLQNDLWELFNWATKKAEVEPDKGQRNNSVSLTERLGIAIHRLALTPEEATALPEQISPQLDKALLPAPEQGWVELGDAEGSMIAPFHVRAFEGRSAFSIHLRLPAGREATLDYLKELAAIKEPTTRNRERGMTEVHDSNGIFLIKEGLPVLPIGTEVSLTRRLVALDRDGNPYATPIVQSLQFRKFVKESRQTSMPPQEFREYLLSKEALFAGKRSLRLLPDDHRGFSHFLVHEFDQIAPPMNFQPDLMEEVKAGDWPARTMNCHVCHSVSQSNGLFTLNSYTGFTMRGKYFRSWPTRLNEKRPEADDGVRYSLGTRERVLLQQWLRAQQEE